MFQMGPSRESEGQEMNRINLIEENPRREARKNTNKQHYNFRAKCNARHKVNGFREKRSLLSLVARRIEWLTNRFLMVVKILPSPSHFWNWKHTIILQNENVLSRILILCLRAYLDLGGVVVVIIKKLYFTGRIDLPTWVYLYLIKTWMYVFRFFYSLKNFFHPCMHLSRRKGIRVRNRMHPLQRASPVSFGWFIDQQLLIHICSLDKNIMNIKKYYYEYRAGSVSFDWFIEQQLLIHICRLDKNIMNINCMENITNRKETNIINWILLWT